jgi:hypothetical protein
MCHEFSISFTHIAEAGHYGYYGIQKESYIYIFTWQLCRFVSFENLHQPSMESPASVAELSFDFEGSDGGFSIPLLELPPSLHTSPQIPTAFSTGLEGNSVGTSTSYTQPSITPEAGNTPPPKTLQGPPPFVKWGVNWIQPGIMVGLAVAGTLVAIGHHFYYLSLNGTKAGSADRQQWSLNFGTAFAVIVTSLLKIACGLAYSQYIWTIIRRNAITINGLDSLFALTTDFTGFFDTGIWRHASFATLLALTCW